MSTTSVRSPLLQRRVVAWALYDWANSSFATTVMVVFFPLFFKQYLTVELSAASSTFWLGVTNGVSSFVLAITAPWLGTLADKSGAHVRLLALFTAIGIVPTALLAWVGVGEWQIAAVLFGIASIGFWGGLTFYDSMLVKVAPRERLFIARIRLGGRWFNDFRWHFSGPVRPLQRSRRGSRA